MTVGEAADDLLDIGGLPEALHDLTETNRGLFVLRRLSMTAGMRLGRHKGGDAWKDVSPAYAWLGAPIAECLAQAERIVETIKEGP